MEHSSARRRSWREDLIFFTFIATVAGAVAVAISEGLLGGLGNGGRVSPAKTPYVELDPVPRSARPPQADRAFLEGGGRRAMIV